MELTDNCVLEKCRTLAVSELILFALVKAVKCRSEFLFLVKDCQAHKVQLCQTFFSLNSSMWGSLHSPNYICTLIHDSVHDNVCMCLS